MREVQTDFIIGYKTIM